MSLHRVSSLETFSSISIHERSRRSSDVSSRSRKLSFNPLPESWSPSPTQEPTQSVSAFEVPKWKRILQVIVTVIYCLFSAGIVFGYAAIKPVLKHEGAYREECAATRNGTTAADEDTCVELRLNFMFTVAAVATNVAALPVGAILDHFGPRVCGVLGCVFLSAGALLMALEKELAIDGLLFGYLFLALGGPFIYISAFQLSNAFPRNSGLILALLTGAFDASSALFLGYRLVYERTGARFGHREFFLGYLVVPAAVLALQFTLLPAQSYKTVGELMEGMENDYDRQEMQVYDQVDEHTALLDEEERQHRVSELNRMLASTKADRQARQEEAKNEISGVWGVMHQHTAWEQIRSLWFILICLFTVIQMLRINYFVATIRPQYNHLLSLSQSATLNTFFDAALPLGGILSIPFIGLILDQLSTLTVLTVLVSTTSLIGLLGLVPGSPAAAYANVALFVLYRPFYYTAVSDYAAKVFGFATFGTVYGAVICLAGVGNLAQPVLDWVLHGVCGGDPGPVNFGLMGTGLVVGVVLVGFVGVEVRRRERERTKMLEREEVETIPIMSGWE